MLSKDFSQIGAALGGKLASRVPLVLGEPQDEKSLSVWQTLAHLRGGCPPRRGPELSPRRTLTPIPATQRGPGRAMWAGPWASQGYWDHPSLLDRRLGSPGSPAPSHPLSAGTLHTFFPTTGWVLPCWAGRSPAPAGQPPGHHPPLGRLAGLIQKKPPPSSPFQTCCSLACSFRHH